MQAHFATFNIYEKIDRVRISSELCAELIGRFSSDNNVGVIENHETKFDFTIIEKVEPLHKKLQEVFIDFDIHVIRLHKFNDTDKAPAHFDSAYSGKDTIIIRLNNGQSRLKIEGVKVPEHIGVGYCLPSGTLHEITESDHTRYSLTIWGSRRNQGNQGNAK